MKVTIHRRSMNIWFGQVTLGEGATAETMSADVYLDEATGLGRIVVWENGEPAFDLVSPSVELGERLLQADLIRDTIELDLELTPEGERFVAALELASERRGFPPAA